MKRRAIWTIAILVILFGTVRTAHSQMIPLSDYGNQRFSTEHCVGYDLQLWKLDGQLYGMLSYCDGLTGDTPTGYIDHVVWNATTGKLTFDAKLSIASDGYGKYTKYFYQFDGVLTPKLISGKMTHQNMGDSPPTPDTAALKLKLDKDETKVMGKYASHDEWRAFYDAMMSNVGPKW